MDDASEQRPGARGGRAAAVFPFVLVALVLAAFLPTLRELVAYWAEHPEYSHGFLMPVVAGWLVWRQRREWAASRAAPSLLGVVVVALSLALLVLGEMKLSWFLKPYALVGALAGLVWALRGWAGLRRALPALVVLLLMCPLPGRVQNAITLPLKNGAALLATGLLDLSGQPASLEGNVIHMAGIHELWVADACSGIRSLISLVSLAILACFLWSRPWPLKVLVVALAVPVAVLVNGLRIYATGMIAVGFGAEAAEGFFHLVEGIVMFGVAGLLLLGAALLLGRLFPGDAR